MRNIFGWRKHALALEVFLRGQEIDAAAEQQHDGCRYDASFVQAMQMDHHSSYSK
jgi:hypothetical protein